MSPGSAGGVPTGTQTLNPIFSDIDPTPVPTDYPVYVSKGKAPIDSYTLAESSDTGIIKLDRKP